MTEPLEHYREIAGFRTRYVEAGENDAVPVLLIHDGAWGGSGSTTWGNSIAKLAESHHVFAPDLLGFGGTDKVVYLDRPPYEARIRHLHAFLDEVVPGQAVHVAGSSFGGSTALRMLDAPRADRFLSVTSVNGTGGPWRTPLALRELATWDGTGEDLRRVARLLIDESSPIFDDHLADRLRWASVNGHYRSVMAPAVPVPGTIVTARPEDPWPSQLSGSSVPVLLVAGNDDVLLEPDWTDHFVSVLADVRVERLDCMHEPNIDRPDLLLPVLTRFFREVEDAARRTT